MKPMRKEIADLIREAMEQHELARDFYHRMAHRVSHQDTRETFEYLAKEAEENKARLHQCLTPEGCPVVPPVHELHLAEHLIDDRRLYPQNIGLLLPLLSLQRRGPGRFDAAAVSPGSRGYSDAVFGTGGYHPSPQGP